MPLADNSLLGDDFGSRSERVRHRSVDTQQTHETADRAAMLDRYRSLRMVTRRDYAGPNFFNLWLLFALGDISVSRSHLLANILRVELSHRYPIMAPVDQLGAMLAFGCSRG